MLARIRKAMDENEQGFTLIELLVVMIIIGILAAIAIPVFLNQRKKAEDAAAKSDVSTIGKEMATYYIDNEAYPAVRPSPRGGRYVLNAGRGHRRGRDRNQDRQARATYRHRATDDTTGASRQRTPRATRPDLQVLRPGGLERAACTAADNALA